MNFPLRANVIFFIEHKLEILSLLTGTICTYSTEFVCKHWENLQNSGNFTLVTTVALTCGLM